MAEDPYSVGSIVPKESVYPNHFGRNGWRMHSDWQPSMNPQGPSPWVECLQYCDWHESGAHSLGGALEVESA